MSNNSHEYNGLGVGRGVRLKSKIGSTITLDRLEELLGKREPIPESKVVVAKRVRNREIKY